MSFFKKELAVELGNKQKKEAEHSKFPKCFVLRIDAIFFGPQMLVSEVTLIIITDQSWDGLKQPPVCGLAKGPPRLELASFMESDRCCI